MSSQSRMYKRDRSTGTRRLANLQPSKSRVTGISGGGGGGGGAVGANAVGSRRGGGGIVVPKGAAPSMPSPSPRQKSRSFFASPSSPPQSGSSQRSRQHHDDEERGSSLRSNAGVALYEDEKKKLRNKPSRSSPVIPGGDVNVKGGGPLHSDAGRQQPGGGIDANRHHGRGQRAFFAAPRSGPAGQKFADQLNELTRTTRRLYVAVVRIWSSSRHARVLGLGLVCLASLFFLLSHSNRRATTDLASLGRHETRARARADGEVTPLGGKNQSASGATSGISALGDTTVVGTKKDLSLQTLNITSNATGSLAARPDSKAAVEGTEPPKYVSPSLGAATGDNEKLVVAPNVSTTGKRGTGGVEVDDDNARPPSKPQIRGGEENGSTARQRGVEGETGRRHHVDAAAPGVLPSPPTGVNDVTSSPAGTGATAETGHENRPKSGENAVVAAATAVAVASTPKERPKPAMTPKVKPEPAVASSPTPPKPKPKPKPDPPSFPPALENSLAEMSVPYDPEHDVPYFWHVALSGGTAMEKMFSSCFHLVQAADVHHGKKNTGDQALSVIRVYGNMYVNLDVTTREGIALAKEKNLVSSHLADVVVTTTVQETAEIFTAENKGRLFTLFHHPVERAVSMFYYLQRATYDPGYNKDLANMTIVEYAKSNYVENNWMTRFLANRRGGVITRQHLDVAKEVIRRKCLIGLTSDFAASVERFEEYFGWHATRESERARECRDKLVKDRDRRHYHPTYEEGSEVWKLLASHNVLDIELYDYATKIFLSQANLTAVA